MKTPKDNERIAVLQVLQGPANQRGEVNIHATVPYISTLRGVTNAYDQHSVRDELVSRIRKSMVTIPLDAEFLGASTISQAIGDEEDHNYRALAKRKKHAAVPHHLKQIRSRLGKVTHDHLPMQMIIRFLFSLEQHVDQIHVFTNLPEIPWDWLCLPSKDRLLCEAFGIGTTVTEESGFDRIIRLGIDRSLPRQELASSHYTALIVVNSYSGESANSLAGVVGLGDRLYPEIVPSIGADFTEMLVDASAREILERIVEKRNTLRLIILVGHYTNQGFLCKGGEHIKDTHLQAAIEAADRDERERKGPDDRSEEEGFDAHPIVILNGCTSKAEEFQTDYRMMRSSQNLARVFYGLGAGACIYTSLPVRALWANKMAIELVQRCFEPGLPLGAAVLGARESFDKNECYEWAAYHLMGSPSYTMLREDGLGTPTSP